MLEYDTQIKYSDYFNLPKDVRDFQSQFNVTEPLIDLIRQGMFNKAQTETKLNILKEIHLLGKPVGIKSKPEGIELSLPTIKFLVPHEDILDELNSVDYDPSKLFGDYCVYKIIQKDKKTQWGNKQENRCVSHKVISFPEKKDTAKKLIEDFGVLGAFASIMGWKQSAVINRMNFTRLFSMVTGNHIFQLTPPNTGKTHLASRLSLGCNWGYFTEKITPARLIFSGQSLQLGEVFLRNGIIIDELSVIKDIKDLEENLLSGLENGIWTRGVTGAEALAEQKRKIPFMFFGNLLNGKLSQDYNGRVELKNLLQKLKFENLDAFIERIAIADLCLNKVNIGGMVAETFHTNSCLRGYLSILEENYMSVRHEHFDEYYPENSRLNNYCNDLAAWVSVVGIEMPKSAIKNIIGGHIVDLDKYLISKKDTDDFTIETPEYVTFEDDGLNVVERIKDYINAVGGTAGKNAIIDNVRTDKYPEDIVIEALDELVRFNELLKANKNGLTYYELL